MVWSSAGEGGGSPACRDQLVFVYEGRQSTAAHVCAARQLKVAAPSWCHEPPPGATPSRVILPRLQALRGYYAYVHEQGAAELPPVSTEPAATAEGTAAEAAMEHS
jgi:hypothetical protein